MTPNKTSKEEDVKRFVDKFYEGYGAMMSAFATEKDLTGDEFKVWADGYDTGFKNGSGYKPVLDNPIITTLTKQRDEAIEVLRELVLIDDTGGIWDNVSLTSEICECSEGLQALITRAKELLNQNKK